MNMSIVSHKSGMVGVEPSKRLTSGQISNLDALFKSKLYDVINKFQAEVGDYIAGATLN